MVKRRRGRPSKQGGGQKVISGSSSQTSGGHFPKVHPASDDCYPLNKLCRLCLLSNTNMEPIFAHPGDIRLSQRIFQCTSLEIHENEEKGIPTSICGQCKRQLEQCHEFRTLCWKNNEVLHNLNLILSPHKAKPASPVKGAVPVVQVEKLKINPSLLPPARTPKRAKSSKSFGEISLAQLYTPSKRGHKAAKIPSRFSRELVICLTPMSAALINKYKKKGAGSPVKSKAAVKSFAPQTNKSPRVQKQKPGRKPSPVKATKREPKAKAVVVPKKTKAKPVEIAVPPKKRKQNFQTPPEVVTVSCSLCTQTFNNLKNLARHTAAHENNRKQNRVFNCDICQKEYLKAAQLTDHLRSAEHVSNASNHAPDDADISILPDENELSLLPDTNGQQDNISTTVASPTNDENADEQELEEAREQSVDREAARSQPSPDDSGQQHIEPQPELPVVEEANQSVDSQAEQEQPSYRELSPISVESSSPKSDGVQYSDVCSTNNEENLFGTSSATVEESFNSSKRVSFADVTEILD